MRTPAGSGEILDDLAEILFQLDGRRWSFSPRQRQILKQVGRILFHDPYPPEVSKSKLSLRPQSAALARDIRNSRNARDARYTPVKTPSPVAFSKEKAIKVAKERTSAECSGLET